MSNKAVLLYAETVRSCTACSARDEAAAPVPGEGIASGIVFVGRNPGKNEDIEGRPFVGRSGALMNQFIANCGLVREQIFITNLILCHTQQDREPTKAEISTCLRLHLQHYFAIIKPYLVVGFGQQVARAIADIRSTEFKRKHGSILRHASGFYFIPCYHPAYALYDPTKRDDVMFGAIQVRRFLRDREKLLGDTAGAGNIT